jgi:SAM-dependent methyltransferase
VECKGAPLPPRSASRRTMESSALGIEWTRCPACAEPMAHGQLGLACTSCSVSLEVGRGVVHLWQRGPHVQRALVDTLARWRDAIEKAPPDSWPDIREDEDADLHRLVFDPCRTDCLHLLKHTAGRRVVVVESGTGLYAQQLAWHGAHVVALDTRLECAELTSARLGRYSGEPRPIVFWGPLDKAPLRPASFDLAVLASEESGWLVQRMEEEEASWQRRIDDAARLLKPQGQALVRVENRYGVHRIRRLVSLPRARWKGRGKPAAATPMLSARRLSSSLRSAGLRPSRPAYGLPGPVYPRFIVGNESGRALGLSYLLRHVSGLGHRNLVMGHVQPVLSNRAVCRFMAAFSPVLYMVAGRDGEPVGGGEQLVLTGWRPFGDHAVRVSIDEHAGATLFTKIARTHAAARSLEREAEGVKVAQRYFAPELRVPRAWMSAGDRLEIESLAGRRLTALLAGIGRSRRLTRHAVVVASALGTIVARTLRTARAEEVVWDPTLPPEDRDKLTSVARGNGISTLSVSAAHGDLQPSNVLIGFEGTVGVVDWEFVSEQVPAAFDVLFLLSEMTRQMRPAPTLDEVFPVAAVLRPAVEAFSAESGLSLPELQRYLPLFTATRAARGATVDDVSRPRLRTT